MKTILFSFKSFCTASLIFVSLSLLSCGGGGGSASGSDSTASSASNDEAIIGAGSSFDNPLFSKMFSEYNKLNGLKVNYQSVGSGAGIAQLTSKTVDFGASDAPMNGKQDSAVSSPVIHIPITAGAVVMSYNLPEVKDTLLLTPGVLADIFLGKITKWNDPKIAAINKGAKLPATSILIAHRSDGSGTTNIFTTYLAKVSPEWNTKVGKGSSVNWPAGLGGKGSEGVAGLIKQTPGAIGYIEIAYAIQNNMAFAKVQNKAGNFITPSIASVTAAANIQIPADSKVSLTNTDAADGYPISGFSWVLIYKEQKYGDRTADKTTKLLKLISWMIHDGQQYSGALNYAPLSPAAVSVGDAILKSATYDGKPILQ
ncbi:MAG: phosphate ABC transporter substrate-binding protein PstS [Bacteroidota bacterium]|nr:phosphate ABC transporter substrate-binding protein PstS [Bacteroidota bacterium]MDP4215228.1 phosphate ABC transporter substrate-binding protein PstS [Bacteroidota bacterium]MDP4246174.1 phosphate ABC transporter substrate-binding protein PstS [Bacteroidota bacterium]MDP4252362.1 phosphate ABC transporter substrate-binding protein PstS [Bacteroidota bacterium]MDP4257919.1 phosphate ABC transporter substrate-binding protein PstS [Bacteroidota bacterium]